MVEIVRTLKGKFAVEDPVKRFWRKVEKTSGCWNWLGAKNNQGYGNFGIGHQTILAHRFAFSLYHPIPKGKMVLHQCDNSSCVRFDHLYAGTSFDNMQDAAKRGRFNQSGVNNNRWKAWLKAAGK